LPSSETCTAIYTLQDDTANELAGRFSSGHVAEPSGKERGKNPWFRERLSGEENGNLHCELSTNSDSSNTLFSLQCPCRTNLLPLPRTL